MYRLATPSAELLPFVHSYWVVHAAPNQRVDLSVDVFVDGRADLVFTFGAPYTRYAPGDELRRIDFANLDAQRLYPIRIVQSGDVFVIGVRFQTAGLMPFVREPVDQWTGQVVSPIEPFGADAARLARDLRLAGGDFAGQVRLLDDFLLRRMRLGPSHRTVMSVKATIEASVGRGRVASLADAVGTSSRHLTRLFQRHVGLSPKSFARITRFQRALDMIARGEHGSMVDLAMAGGYFDQSHLVREFRRFSGRPPSQRVGYFPAGAPRDFSPNLVRFVQADAAT